FIAWHGLCLQIPCSLAPGVSATLSLQRVAFCEFCLFGFLKETFMKYPLILRVSALCVLAVGLSACSSMGGHSMYSQANLPAAVQVPGGHKVVMETVGVG